MSRPRHSKDHVPDSTQRRPSRTRHSDAAASEKPQWWIQDRAVAVKITERLRLTDGKVLMICAGVIAENTGTFSGLAHSCLIIYLFR